MDLLIKINIQIYVYIIIYIYYIYVYIYIYFYMSPVCVFHSLPHHASSCKVDRLYYVDFEGPMPQSFTKLPAVE